MSWHKRDDDYWTSPKIALAGEDAALVFDVLLGINNRRKRRGKLLPEDLAIDLIRVRLGCARRSPKQIRKALERCELAELLKFDEQQGAEIVGYDEDWAPRLRSAASDTDATPPVDFDSARVESDSKCSRCGRRTDGRRRCEDCAAQDARRVRAAARAGSAQIGAGLGAATAQIAAQRFAQVGAGLAQGPAQIGAGSAQTAPRAGASDSDSEIEIETKKKKPARPLVHPTRSTTAREERRAGGPDVPTGRGEPDPEEPQDGRYPEFCIKPGETTADAVARLRALASGPDDPRDTDANQRVPDALVGLQGRIYGEPQ